MPVWKCFTPPSSPWSGCAAAALVCAVLALPALPARAQEDVAPDDGDRVTFADTFRDRRSAWGRQFEESAFGAHVIEHVDVTLEYRFYQFLDEGTPADSRRSRHEGRLEVEYENALTDNVELFTEFRIWVDDDDYAKRGIEEFEDDDRRRPIFNITEAYMDFFFDDFDVRVGKQIVKWGKADVFNPTDRINPDDFSTLLDDEPIGVVAGKVNYWFEGWGLEVVVVPTFTPSRFPPGGTRFSLVPTMLPLPLLPPKERPDTIHDTQYGARLTTTYEGWDFSASWYDGVNHFPGVEVVPVPIFPGLAFEPVYHRLRVLGGDFATTLDKLGLHGEGAWYQSDGQREDDYLVYVLGLDYTWVDVYKDHDIFAILEYAGEHVTEQEKRAVAGSGLQRAFANTFAANINYEVDEFLQYTLRWVYNFDGPDSFLIEPEVAYEVNDHFTVIAGVDIIHGADSSSLFGLLRENDQFYLKARYTF